MKKVLSILLCGFLVFSLSGCGKEDSSNQTTGTSNEDSFNAEALEKNITVTNSAEAEDGTLVAIIKNGNDEAVYIDVEVVFYDAEGNSLGSDTEYLNIYNNQEMACEFYGTPSDYSDYEINIKASENYYTNYSNQIEVTQNNTGEQIAVQIKNNSGTDIDSVEIATVFYRDGNIVGFYNDYATDLRADGTANSNVRYPYDKNYDDVSFDEYTIYVSAYNY